MLLRTKTGSVLASADDDALPSAEQADSIIAAAIMASSALGFFILRPILLPFRQSNRTSWPESFMPTPCLSRRSRSCKLWSYPSWPTPRADLPPSRASFAPRPGRRLVHGEPPHPLVFQWQDNPAEIQLLSFYQWNALHWPHAGVDLLLPRPFPFLVPSLLLAVVSQWLWTALAGDDALRAPWAQTVDSDGRHETAAHALPTACTHFDPRQPVRGHRKP